MWAGAGGVLTSARDLVGFFTVSLDSYFMVFLGGLEFDVEQKGSHLYTNEIIILEEVVDHVAYGRSVSQGKPQFPELVSTHARCRF